MSDITNLMPTLLLVLAVVLIGTVVLTFVTNLLVQVIKQFTKQYVPTQAIVVIVAELITILALIIACQVFSITMIWYYVVGAVLLGLFVSYTAIFGFDNVYSQVWEMVKKIKQIIADLIGGSKDNT